MCKENFLPELGYFHTLGSKFSLFFEFRLQFEISVSGLGDLQMKLSEENKFIGVKLYL